VLEVISTLSRQGGLKHCRPLPVHPGHTPNLVRCQVQVAKCRPEWLTGLDRIEELLAQLGRESLLRLTPEAGLGGVVWAWRHRAQLHPLFQRVMVPWGT
jgi:predicted component of type VI protein secretion system